jgi:hypothetical protein
MKLHSEVLEQDFLIHSGKVVSGFATSQISPFNHLLVQDV